MIGQSRGTYSKYDPRACLPFLVPSTTTQKAAGNFSLRKQGVQSPANLRSGKITESLVIWILKMLGKLDKVARFIF